MKNFPTSKRHTSTNISRVQETNKRTIPLIVDKKMQKNTKCEAEKQQWQTNWARLRWAKSCCITNKQTNGARKVGVDKCTRVGISTPVDICTGSSATPVPAHAYHNYPGNPCNKFILYPHILHQLTLTTSSYSTHIFQRPQDHALDHTYCTTRPVNQVHTIVTSLPDMFEYIQQAASKCNWETELPMYIRQASCPLQATRRPCIWARHVFM